MMFSHTVKGQPYNTPLLARFLASPGPSTGSAELLPRLLDYELLMDETSGKRTVGFGWFAGGAYLFVRHHIHLTLGTSRWRVGIIICNGPCTLGNRSGISVLGAFPLKILAPRPDCCISIPRGHIPCLR